MLMSSLRSRISLATEYASSVGHRVAAGALGESAAAPGSCISRPWDNTAITVKKIELFDHVGAPLAHTAARVPASLDGVGGGCQVHQEARLRASRVLGVSRRLPTAWPATVCSRCAPSARLRALQARLRRRLTTQRAQRTTQPRRMFAGIAWPSRQVRRASCESIRSKESMSSECQGSKASHETSLFIQEVVPPGLLQGGGHVEPQSDKETFCGSARVGPDEANWLACSSNRGKRPCPMHQSYELS